MAKRKRLTPAVGLETKSFKDGWAGTQARSGGPAASSAPIADVAGSAATAAALDELAHEVQDARTQGRMVVRAHLDQVDETYLVRDRAALDPDDMEALKTSIAARGQQTPIEVVDLGEGATGARYGLISGWRRLTALKALHAENPKGNSGRGFEQIQCLLRSPETASDAYIAMVEENEIRAALSHYERARIAARASEQGAFETPRKAAKALFGSIARAKRSKIYSFITIYEALDDVLRFGPDLSEREGLAIAKALDGNTGVETEHHIRAALTERDPQTSDAERKLIADVIKPKPKKPLIEPEIDSDKGYQRETYGSAQQVIRFERKGTVLILSGRGVDADLEAELRVWLDVRG